MVKSNPSLDTNCILRWTLRDIPEQAAAVDKLFKSKTTITIDDMAIWETAYVLEKLYKLPRDLVAGHIEKLLSVGNVRCSKDFFQAVLPIYVSNPSISFTDVCLTLYAQFKDNLPLFTLDKQLAATLKQARLLE